MPSTLGHPIKLNEKMKKMHTKNCLLIAFILFGWNILEAQTLQINGNLKNVKDQTTVTLSDGISSKSLATGKVIAGQFTLSANSTIPTIYLLGMEENAQKIPLFFGAETVSIEGDFSVPTSIKVTGSSSHDLYKQYMDALNPLMENYVKTLGAIQNEKNTVVKDSLTSASTAQSVNIIDLYKNISSKNNASPVTTFFLLQFGNIFPNIKDNLASYYDQLTGAAKTGPFAEFIEKSLQSASFGQIGSQLPDFTQNDPNGKPIKLSSFRGKYVLIDFWASWCGPCRAENPNIVKAYNAFKGKNFTILGVSLDQDKAKWLEAIKKDGLTWTHVSDLKYWNNEVAASFGIQSIPASFLIDPQGKIIARDLRGAELKKFLTENLK